MLALTLPLHTGKHLIEKLYIDDEVQSMASRESKPVGFRLSTMLLSVRMVSIAG
jgi:hypothetical protein